MRCGCRDRRRPSSFTPSLRGGAADEAIQVFLAASGLLRRFAPRNDETYSELHRRGLLDLLAVTSEVEEVLAGEAHGAGKQGCGHLLDAGVVLLHRVIEEAAAGGDLVLDIGQFAL